MMVDDSNESSIKLVDFGLSKILGPTETSTEPFGTLVIPIQSNSIVLCSAWSAALEALWEERGSVESRSHCLRDAERHLALRCGQHQGDRQEDYLRGRQLLPPLLAVCLCRGQAFDKGAVEEGPIPENDYRGGVDASLDMQTQLSYAWKEKELRRLR